MKKCGTKRCGSNVDGSCTIGGGPACAFFSEYDEQSATATVESQSAGCVSEVKRRNPVRVLNDALHEYRTSQTTMTKDEFYESGCYSAFMWAWQNSTHNRGIDVNFPPMT